MFSKEFELITQDIAMNTEFMKLNDFRHHGISRLDHSYRVAYYSYKIMMQSAGIIDRMNTRFEDLYYYHLKTHSGIDLAISKAIKNKKKFNERDFTSI